MTSVVGPDPEIVKFIPLLITLPLGSSHCTARVAVGVRSCSLLALHISEYPEKPEVGVPSSAM